MSAISAVASFRSFGLPCDGGGTPFSPEFPMVARCDAMQYGAVRNGAVRCGAARSGPRERGRVRMAYAVRVSPEIPSPHAVGGGVIYTRDRDSSSLLSSTNAPWRPPTDRATEEWAISLSLSAHRPSRSWKATFAVRIVSPPWPSRNRRMLCRVRITCIGLRRTTSYCVRIRITCKS